MPRRSTTSPEEARALRASGARLTRHAHDMVLELPVITSRPRLPMGLSMRAGVAPVPALIRLRLAAYRPGHPDVGMAPRSAEEHGRDLAEVLGGRVAGPVLEDASGAIEDAARAVVGAVIVTRVGVEAWGWPGGPWVADVMVAEDWQGRGLGRALLVDAIAACTAAGEVRIGLTVTDGNPAERLYAALGFERRRTLYVFDA